MNYQGFELTQAPTAELVGSDIPAFNQCFTALKPFFAVLERSFEDATR
jgi:hypothetical protein